jgi:gluconate 2-dehydrogenase gamma chain
MPEISRREFLAAAGVTAAASWFTFDRRALIEAATQAQTASRFEVLSAADAADIEAAAAQIIPSDGTPGAREARVVYFIDKGLSTFAKDQRAVFEKGAAELRKRAAREERGAKSFAAISPASQIRILQALEKEKHPFFGAVRQATIVGMFANPEYGGNHDKTGWKMIGFNDQFSWGAPFGWYDRG